MISLKVLSTAAAMALVLPIAMPTASFADPPQRALQDRAGRAPRRRQLPSGRQCPRTGGNAQFSPGR